MTLERYWCHSREPRYSLLFAFPLLALYEGLALALSGSAMAGVRNGADVLLKTVFVAAGGRAGLAAFGVLVIGGGAWFVWRDLRARRSRLEARVFGGMVLESVIYAAAFGNVVAWLTDMLLGGHLAVAAQGPVSRLPVASQLVISLGAGIYEELLFRVLLVSALVGVGRRMQWRPMVSASVAVVVSALIFSGFHYVGPFGDPFAVASFTFRAVAGVMLSVLYVTRGFGITAWTHALYDVGLAILRG